MRLNEQVKYGRERAGLSREDFAKALNISVNYVYQIEGGQKHPPIRLVAKIADVLKERISVLLQDDEIVQRLRAEIIEEVVHRDADGSRSLVNSH